MLSVADVVISMKFHGLVFGMMAAKGVVNIAPSRKNLGIMEASGLSRFSLPPDELTATKLLEVIGAAADAGPAAKVVAEDYRAQVNSFAQKLRGAYQ